MGSSNFLGLLFVVQPKITKKHNNTPALANVILYRFVYSSVFSVLAILILGLALLLSSVSYVFASSEGLETTEGEISEVPAEESPPPADIENTESESQSESDNLAEDFDDATDQSESDLLSSAIDLDEPESVSDTEISEVETGGHDNQSIDQAEPAIDGGDENVNQDQISSVTEDGSEDVAETIQNDESGDGGDSSSVDSDSGGDVEKDIVNEIETNIGSSTDEQVSDETQATTSDEIIERVDVVNNADNYYQFSREECVRVEDGSFYCGISDTEKTEDTEENRLLSAPDKDGDLEIFLYYNGEQTQITHNEVDDAAPYFDPVSNTIVWHRLINDRYQIISYDIDSGKEVQLTNGSVNNMEPSRYDDYIAWQRWVENNWEIILHDGKNERIISNSQSHDVAPLVYEDLVIWNTTDKTGKQQIVLYDLATEELSIIDDGGGSSVQNPRMVLVYETALENGDIVTKGFDLASRVVVPLSAQPHKVPEKIPNSDQTGETRALIQTKPTGKESEIVVTTPKTSPPDNQNNQATSSDSGISVSTTTKVVNPVPSATTSPTSSNTELTATSTTEFEDLIVPVFVPDSDTEASTTRPVEIEDLVIPSSQTIDSA